jgi:hypothetical protein
MAKPDINWKATYFTFFVLSLALALASYALRAHSLVGLFHLARASVIGLAVLALLVVGLAIADVLTVLNKRVSEIRQWAHKKVVEAWHLLLAWMGIGLSMYAFAEFVHGQTPSLLFAALLAGPLVLISLPSKFLVILCFLVWSLVVGEFIHKFDVASLDERKGLFTFHRTVRKVVSGAEFAPAKAPQGSHFTQVQNTVQPFLIKEKDVPSRLSLGVASLAPKWGMKKEEIDFGLPFEGQGVVFGEPGSGKTQILNRAIGGLDGTVRTKLIITSVKTQDYVSFVPWLRSCGFRVRMFDLTGATAETDEYGDQTRWSPISLCDTAENAQIIAAMSTEAAVDSHNRTKDEFWAISATRILAPCFRAANIANKNLEWSFGLAKKWGNPEVTEVENTLRDREPEMCADFINIRKFMLDMETRTDEEAIAWKEKAGLSGAAGTGQSIDATLQNYLARLATGSAYRATRDPNFEINEWIESDQSEVLFLVGDMEHIYTTRSIFAVLVNRLLIGLGRYARQQEGERLPYKCYCILDEMANLSPVPQIESLYSTMRSLGVQVLAIFQSRAQVSEMLGLDKALIFLGAATLMLILPGITDAHFINELASIAGGAYVSLSEGQISSESLVQGGYITRMQTSNFETGEPGQALALTRGGFTELKMPIWALEDPYCDRGVVPMPFRESTEKLRLRTRTRKERFTDYSRGLWRRPKAAVVARGKAAAKRVTTSPSTRARSEPVEAPNVATSTAPGGAVFARPVVAPTEALVNKPIVRPVVSAPVGPPARPANPVARPLVRPTDPVTPIPSAPSKTRRRHTKTKPLIDPKAKALPPESGVPCGDEWTDPFDGSRHICVSGSECPTCKRSIASV